MREKVRGEYRVSSRIKQKKKSKICFVIYNAGFFFKKHFCHEVIVKQILKNGSLTTNSGFFQGGEQCG
jgi:hypothetical protein